MTAPNVRALLARAKAKAVGFAPEPLAVVPSPSPFPPTSRVQTIAAGRRVDRADRGTVVELVNGWIYWLADDRATHLSDPSFLVREG